MGLTALPVDTAARPAATRLALPAARGRVLAGLAALGAVLIAVGVAITLSSGHTRAPVAAAVSGSLLMASWIGTGLIAWSRRPQNLVGPLMAATGFAAFLGALSGSSDPVVFALGVGLSNAFLATAVHMLLAFPTGRITSRAQRRLLAAGYVLAFPMPVAAVLVTRDVGPDAEHPANGLLVADLPAVASAIEAVAGLTLLVVLAGVVTVLVRRWRDAPARDRRALTPVLLAGVATVVLLAALVAAQGIDKDVAAVVSVGVVAALAAVPFAFLLGLVRSRAWRTGAVTELVEALAESDARGRLRDALAEALGDPTLELAYWLPDDGRYVDAEGRPVHVPPDGGRDRVATEVERDGRPVGALLHDAALCDEPELIRSVGAAASLALLNERLDAELRARVEELRRSRQRIVEAAVTERRRLERDLHDGAQQRLVALALQLGLAAQHLDAVPEDARLRRLVEGARDEAGAALEDLRELARGIHPAVLTDRGLGPALGALAARSPVPVDVVTVPADRLPAVIEAAVYFVVAESLTNVAKYAGASRVEVRVTREHGFVLAEVRDDGVGGADASAGSGLRGLADRVAALDGRLELESAPGRGTTVRARIPG